MKEMNNEKTYQELYNAICAIKDTTEAKNFLMDLCTPAELQALADRWHVVHPIKEGTPYRTIHDNTGISVTTIGRVARFINYGHGGYNMIYNRVNGKAATVNQKEAVTA